MPLSVSAVSKRFGQNWALRNVSLNVEPGHIVGVCGPAGAGKSTLLSIIAGRDSASSGRIEMDGSPLNGGGVKLIHAWPERRSGWLSYILARAKPQSDTKFAGDLVNMLADSEAKVFLLDDVLSLGAPQRRTLLFDEIRDLSRRRKNYVLLATADFGQVLEFCDSAFCLLDGEIAQSGTPEQLYTEPSNSRVAKFTGRVNVFAARRISSSKADVPEYQTIDGSHRLAVGPVDRARLGPIDQNMVLAVRPEHVSISFGASFPEDNLIKAGVVSVKFLGPMTLVELDADGLRVTALVRRLVGLRPGDECMLGMPPDRIMVFRD